VLFPPLCIITDNQTGIELTRPEEAVVRWKILELLERQTEVAVSE
jgi:hypothetical protein